MRAGLRRFFRLRATLAVLLGSMVVPIAVASASAEDVVAFVGTEAPGTIVVSTAERRLYFVLTGDRAVRYVVGVGREGRQWSGAAVIDGKFVEPNWAPPDAVRRDRPNLPSLIAGGTAANPLGAAAMTISGGSYAIHGTNAPASIGGYVSYGCIRMYNRDVLALYERVRLGTPVVVR
jgi:lipoprotein-anchoring transpeptidase ErfK/SrfK